MYDLQTITEKSIVLFDTSVYTDLLESLNMFWYKINENLSINKLNKL